jgi:hypothetical protein
LSILSSGIEVTVVALGFVFFSIDKAPDASFEYQILPAVVHSIPLFKKLLAYSNVK